MNVDDKDLEPSTNLSLALGYSNQCIQGILDNDPGAGANAASTVDMTFVATDPLSELVWSPHKGLSLRCADGSFTDKRPSLSLDVRPHNMASGSSSDKPISSTDKPMNNEICIASLAACNMDSDAAGGDNFTTFPASNADIVPLSGTSLELRTATGDQAEEMKNVADFHSLKKEDQRNSRGEDGAKLDIAQNNPSCEEPIVRNTDVIDGSRALGMEIVLASQFHTVKEGEAYDITIKNATPSGKRHEELPLIREEDCKNKMVINPHGIFPLDRLESTAENCLETPFSENVFVNRVENNSQQGEDLLPTDEVLAVKQPPTNSRLQYNQTKGKSKALSDGDESERTLNQEDGSHESVESCNSAGLLSTGKRRWNFEQQLIVGSKRVKRHVQESPGSSSLGKQDSSFVNWISNMMKGCLKPSGREEPLVSATVSKPNHGHENNEQGIFTCNRNEDPGCKTIGFQSIFQSLYRQKTKDQETVTLNADHQVEGSKECEWGNKICDLNATPIACRMVTGNVYKRFLPSNERFNESTSDKHTAAVHSRHVSMSFPAIQENNRSNSAENKNSCDLATGKEKDGTSSNSQGKPMTNFVVKVDSELETEEKTAHNLGYKSDPSESLWITRFMPKTSGLSLNQHTSNQSTGEALNCSADGMTLRPQLQNPLSSSSEHTNVKFWKQSTEEPLHVQNHGAANEASFSFFKVKGHHDENSTYELSPILPSPRLKTSGAMASIFARRLDALKHIKPSVDPDDTARAAITCFFCGIKGHCLQECPDVAETELEDLLRTINLNEGMKELPCFCIRCFQLNHWAIACPGACSRVRNLAESDASLVNQCGLKTVQLNVRKEDDKRLKDISASAPTVCYGKDSGVEKNINKWEINEVDTSGKMKLNVKLFEKEIASSSMEKRLKENQMMPIHGFIDDPIPDVPKGIFDAVRGLRLTRTNILKWMNSEVPLSPLDGYFVRLRLGKWEEGLGGTGYYVACITGIRMEISSKKSKKSIAVNVGGIKCIVESQYVSNHDFLEDELKAWWSATSKGGGKLPTEEELRLKVEEKKTLGI